MPFKESSGYCSFCKRQVLVRRETTNDVLYAILTLFSCGLFGIVWIISSLASSSKPWLCTHCGQPTGSDPNNQNNSSFGDYFSRSNTDTSNAPTRNVDLGLALGIFFLPFIFAWFTLREGYSAAVRTVSFVWLGIVVIAWASTSINSPNYSTTRQSLVPANVQTTQPSSSPASTKPLARLSKTELEQSFRQMLSSNFSCFDYVKTKFDRVSGQYVLSGAPTGAKDWCVEYLPRISWDDEKKHADDWATQNNASLVALKVTHVNIFYCTDPYGRSCHFIHAIDVK